MEAMTEQVLQVDNLSMTYADNNENPRSVGYGGLQALDNISFSVALQEFVCVLGPSGSGKTTLLRILAGLLRPTTGSVTFSPCGNREKPCIGLVFQQANLMPWRTALENITLPLELKGSSPEEARAQAQTWINQVGLQGFEDSWPRDLSGGMAQRVAIARALIQDPDLLLLDEPFGSLDALTRERMADELLDLWQARRKTVIMVTHSISEALLLSDRVLVFTPRPGQICLDLAVDLPRPRADAIRYTEHFGELARQLRNAIM
jgi:NitT/TauT family transport system ATP-binding protein